MNLNYRNSLLIIYSENRSESHENISDLIKFTMSVNKLLIIICSAEGNKGELNLNFKTRYSADDLRGENFCNKIYK